MVRPSIILISVVTMIIGFIFVTDEGDKKYLINNLSEESEYISSHNFQKLSHGKLSTFYTCLLVDDKKANTFSKKKYTVKLWFSELTYMYLTVYNTTVTSYEFYSLSSPDGGAVKLLNKSSSVNCDLSLIEKYKPQFEFTY